MTSASTAMIAAGIFAHEFGQRFLGILLSLGERGFKGLYDKCAQNIGGDYYQRGLRRVHVWSDAVLQEDVDFVKQSYPDLEDTYEACFAQYVADCYRGSKRVTTRTPTLLHFVRGFLESLGQHEALATGDYFARRDTVYKRVACMDAARTALYALMTVENVRVELLSETGSALAAKSAVDAPVAAVAAPTTTAPPKASTVDRSYSSVRTLAETSEADLRGGLAEEVEVTPADSVSQIGRTQPARAPSVMSSSRKVSRPPTVVSRADNVEAPTHGAAASRPPSTVSRHEEDVPKSKFRAAAPPSTVSRHDVDEEDGSPPPRPSRTPSVVSKIAERIDTQPMHTSPPPVPPPQSTRRQTQEPEDPSPPPRPVEPRQSRGVGTADALTVEETADEAVLVYPPARKVIHSSNASNVSIGVKAARSPRY